MVHDRALHNTQLIRVLQNPMTSGSNERDEQEKKQVENRKQESGKQEYAGMKWLKQGLQSSKKI